MHLSRQLREEFKIDYGLSFQMLNDIHYNAQNEAIATIEVSKENAMHSSVFYVIRPITLDGLFHLIFVALTRGGDETLQTMILTRVGRMWISSLEKKVSSPASLLVYTRAKLLSKRSAQRFISALDCLSQALKIEIQDLEITVVSGHSPLPLVRGEAKRLCHHIF